MKLLVTGCHGQLALSLARQAAAIDWLEPVFAGRPELDLGRPETFAGAIDQVAPGMIINAAAFTNVDQAEDEPDLAMRLNGDAAGALARVARERNIPIIHISTDYVFDGVREGPYREDDAPAPASAYGRSKLVGEEQVRAATPDHLIVRTAWLYSPFGHNFVKTIMRLASERDELAVVDDQVGNPSSALDLADGLIALLGRWRRQPVGFGQTYHLAGSGSCSWFDFANAIMAASRRAGGPSARVRPVATTDWPTTAPRPANSMLDSTRFATDFGFRMPDWRVSLGQVVTELARSAANPVYPAQNS